MKDLRTTLQRTLNEAEEKIKEEVVKLPMIERDMRIRALKQRFGESHFKRFKPEDFMKSENEGFFFHYNPSAKKYYEGNASFQFMFFKVSASRELSSPPEIDDYWNNYNFKVDHLNNTITAEKQWSETKLRNPSIENPGAWKKALEIATKRHPEIEDYKVVGIKGVSSIEDVMEMPSADLIGKDKDFYVYYGDAAKDIKKALKKGMRGPFSAEFTYSAALKTAKIDASSDPDGAWGVVKIKVNGKDDITAKAWGLQIAKDVEAEDIELVKSNTAEAFEEESNRTYYEHYPEIWKKYFEEVIVTTKEDIDALARVHELSARENKKRRSVKRSVLSKPIAMDGYYVLTTKSHKRILLLDQEHYNDRTIKDALGYTVFDWSKALVNPGIELSQRLKVRLQNPKNESDFELIREWVFENNPPSEVAQEVVKKLLDASGPIAGKTEVIEFLMTTMPLASIKLPRKEA